MITFCANTRRATAVSDDAITTRSVGIPVTLDLSEHFDGLAVTLVCKAGEVSRDIAVLDHDALEVPVDCLQVAGVPLLLGLVGKNAAGTVVIRTIMVSAGTIRVGTEESDVDPSDPTPDWTAQVQQYAQDAHDTAERLAEQVDGWEGEIDAAVDGAEAVDVTVEQGDGSATVTVTDRTGTRHTATVHDGATGPAGADGYSPTATVEQLADGATISITDKSGTTTATIHDGADGATGPEGPAGYSPSARVTQTASGATITVADQSGTTTADISNGDTGPIGPIGPTGEDGFSPTVDVQPITGGHEVTITDADGAHSFDVMDGDPAEPGSITNEMLAPDGIKQEHAWLWGNQLAGELSGTIDTASDAYAAPPMALTVEGASTQNGTPTPDAPVPIISVDELSVHASADGGTTDYTHWPVTDLLPDGTVLRSLPDGTKDALNLSYLRPSTRDGWAWYSREIVQAVGEATNLDQLNWLRNNSNGIFYVESTIYVPDYVRTVNTPSRSTFAQYTGTVTGTLQQSAKGDNTYGLLTVGYTQRGIYVKATAYADVASFVAALAGQSLNYALATPVTTTLDPIELPQLPAPNATVWCDGGSAQPTFTMQYVQDTTIVIQQLEAAIADLATS